MKTTQRSVLKVAILSALGALSTNALAVADLSGQSISTVGPVRVAKELPSTGTLTSSANGQLGAYIAVPTGYAVDATNKYLNIKVNLLGGARFAAVPSLACNSATSAGVTPAGAGLGSVISIGGNGASNVTFVVTAGTTPAAASGAYCYLTADSISYTGTTDKTISATIEYKDGANNVPSGTNGTFISFVKGLSASFSPGQNVVIDVAASSNKFSAGNVTGYAGIVQFGGITTSALVSALNASVTTPYIVTTGMTPQFSITIGGAPLAGASNVYLSNTPANCGNASYSATISTSASTTVTITANGTDISAGLGVCLVYSGTTPIPEGTITATIGRSMEINSYQADFSPVAASLANFKKNGASLNVDFLTNPNGYPTFVRFTNPSSLSGNVLVDAYNDDGAKGTTTWTFVLGAGKSVMYPMDVIVTKTGVAASTTPATDGALGGNKFRLIVNAEFPTLSVQALNLSKDGNAFGQLTNTRSATP